MILVTGAAGKTGAAVIRALQQGETPIRALVHKDSQIQHFKPLGVNEVLAGDMRSQEHMNQVFKGVRAVYHIPPNVSPQEFSIGQVAIKAAQSAGVEHFVFHSVLHPQIESMPHHWQKMRVEEALFESGLSFTILQPAAYMQNVLAYWENIVEKGLYVIPYAVDTRLNLVDLEDVAKAAAVVLNDPGHIDAIYELCGPENLSHSEVAKRISQHLGQKVDLSFLHIEEWQVQARCKGIGDYQIKTLVKMFRYYESFGFTGNSNALACLLNRPPVKFGDFLVRLLREWT